MKYEWCYFNSVFTEGECDKIIEDSLDIVPKSGAIGSPDGFVVEEKTRRSDVRFVSNSDHRFSWVFDKLWEYARKSNNEYFFFNVTHLTYLQIAEYSYVNKGEYTKHNDVIWYNPDYPYHRKLSCTIQLSSHDDYTGGEFEFHDLGYSYPSDIQRADIRSKGTAIFFPSFINHSVAPVLTGIRYSLTAWFEGPKWR